MKDRGREPAENWSRLRVLSGQLTLARLHQDEKVVEKPLAGELDRRGEGGCLIRENVPR
jgi:hypothetical protein